MRLNSDNSPDSQLNSFQRITLAEIDKVKLMRRVDTKYVLHVEKLPLVLKQFFPHYFLVEIDGVAIQNYKTVYFDTPDYKFYLQHHNRIKNRFKVRFRTYLQSNLSFLEVKHKNNRKETVKSRLEQPFIYSELDKEHSHFIQSKINDTFQELTPSLQNTFNRITLVSKSFNERITIDTGVSVYDIRNLEKKDCNRLCIIETKRDINLKHCTSFQVLQNLRIKPTGFSKYCMGLALTNKQIKKNLFKPRLLKYKSILN